MPGAGCQRFLNICLEIFSLGMVICAGHTLVGNLGFLLASAALLRLLLRVIRSRRLEMLGRSCVRRRLPGFGVSI